MKHNRGLIKLCILLACLAVPASACAEDAAQSQITIENAYAFATAPGETMGAAFMNIRNAGAAPDHLISASTEIAGGAEIHTTMEEGNNMIMAPEGGGLDVPAGKTLIFDPHGHHIMLTGLHAPLKEGTSFTLKLKFLKAGEIATRVPVRAAGDVPPSQAKVPAP